MRVSPVGFAFDCVEDVLREAEKTAAPTHNHPEGIKGAQAVALAVFLARSGSSKNEIRESISRRFDYDLTRSLDEIRPTYCFEISCQKSVPESIIAFLESEDVKDAIRRAISLGGDADTMACIAGGIAEAFYGGVPPQIEEDARRLVPDELMNVVDRFYAFTGRAGHIGSA
jgi:ADP-ribosylglycohydrolase